MAKVSIAELVTEVGVPLESLNKPCHDEHLRKVSLFLDWRATAPHLGLDQAEIQAIDHGEKTEQEKRSKTLQMWKSKYAFKATYRRLAGVLLSIGRADHAEKVCQVAGNHDYLCTSTYNYIR